MLLKDSKTKDNLMRAFAGESQARNRYTFAASQAKKSNLYVVEKIFTFTADQERAHAQAYYNLLKDMAGENIAIDGSYPFDIHDDIVKLLRSAQHNEYEEYETVYPAFAKVAEEEGFTKIATMFKMIAAIEKVHGDRFGHFADLIEQGKLFESDTETYWMCLNCGQIFQTKTPPQKCPVCEYDKGYFIRLSMVPFEGAAK